jgi:hypothetical protein
MSGINLGRVVLGGLVAGVVLNIGEFILNEVLLKQDMQAEFQRLNLAQPGSDFIAKAVILTFVLGIVLVYLYAAIRPRCGAGVKTAVCAGVLGWFFVYLYCGALYTALGLFSMKLFLVSLPWGIVEYAVAAIAGAWLYKETEA